MYNLTEMSINDMHTLLIYTPCLSMSSQSFVNRNRDMMVEFVCDHKKITKEEATDTGFFKYEWKIIQNFCVEADQYNKKIFNKPGLELFKLMNLPSEYISDLSELVRYINNCVQDFFSDRVIMNNESRYILKKWFEIVLFDILPYKFKAFSRLSSIGDKVRPASDKEYEFSKNPYFYLIKIFQKITDNVAGEYTEWINDAATIIYLILSGLNLKKDECWDCPIFIQYCNLIKTNSGNAVSKRIFSICKNNDDVIDYIHNIRFNEDFISYYSSHFIEKLVKDKKTVSMVGPNHILIFGDNIIPESVDIEDFVIAVKKLRPWIIHKYTKNQNPISFGFNENKICGIIYEFPDIKKCIIKDQNETHTIIKYNETLYLLFADNHYGDIKGISIFEISPNKRKLINFELSNDLEYKVSFN